MGRLGGSYSGRGGVYGRGYDPLVDEAKPWTAVVYDAWFDKKLNLSNGHILNPTRILLSGPPGGGASFEYTGCAFTEDGIDEDKLIGAYVRVLIGDEVVWVGTLTGFTERTDGIVEYEGRDLWHALADKSMRAEFPKGITSGGLLGVIAGGVYQTMSISKKFVKGSRESASSSTPSWVTMWYDPPLLPCNSGGEAIVDISEELIWAGNCNLPRDIRNQAVNDIIQEMADEQEVDDLFIEPYPMGNDKLGKIVPLSWSSDERSIVLGGTDEDGWESIRYVPFVESITYHESYDGVITQLIAVGGEVTQTALVALVPAWDSSLSADLLANPERTQRYPGIYGPVGRVYTIGDEPWKYPILPFVDEAIQTPNLSDTIAAYKDSCRIFEHHRSIGSTTDDTAWRENSAPAIIARYNDDIAATGLINYRGKKATRADRDKMGIVYFDVPQIEKQVTTVGDSNVEARYFKSMYMQCMRIIGRTGYDTGHRGKFPRPRFRFLDFPEAIKHSQQPYTDESGGITRFSLVSSALGQVESFQDETITGSYKDTTGFMNYKTESAIEELSRANCNMTIEIPRIDLSWKRGTRITKILNTSGSVIRDQQEITVMHIAYDRRNNSTQLLANSEVIW